MEMQGVFLTGARSLELRETAVPEVTPGMVRIRVHRAGICSTDLVYWNTGKVKGDLPVILGHEISGVIEETAPDVTEFRVGDRVLLTNDYHLCGRCRYCRGGMENMCLERRSIGNAENGGFADYMVVPARMVLHLPDALSFEEGALAEVVACSVHLLRNRAGAKAGDLVLVMGPGIMGLTAAITAKAMGCRVVLAGLGSDAARLDKAREMGIRYAVNRDEEDLEAVVAALSDGYGADITVDGTGSFRALADCFRLTAKGGTVAQLAIPRGSGEIDLSLVGTKELRYVGSYAKVREDWELTLKWMAEGKIRCGPLVSGRMALRDYEEAFSRVASAKELKVMFCLCD